MFGKGWVHLLRSPTWAADAHLDPVDQEVLITEQSMLLSMHQGGIGARLLHFCLEA